MKRYAKDNEKILAGSSNLQTIRKPRKVEEMTTRMSGMIGIVIMIRKVTPRQRKMVIMWLAAT